MELRSTEPQPAYSGGRPQRRPEVVSYDAAEEMVLYDRRNHLAVSLNLSASAVWDLCDGTRSVEGILTELAATLGEEQRALVPDVERLLHELHGLDLLVLQTGDTPEPARGELN